MFGRRFVNFTSKFRLNSRRFSSTVNEEHYDRSVFSGISFFTRVMIASPAALMVAYAIYEYRKTNQKMKFYSAAITEKVFLDIAIGNKYAGRVLIGLYGNELPMTTENFIRLCEGYIVGDKTIGYKNTPFHSIHPNIMMVGGDVVTGRGTHSLSIYGPKFPDESFTTEFVQEGDVAMWNNGPNSNGSQFFISFTPLQPLTGRFVVIGTVLKGMKVIRLCEREHVEAASNLRQVRIIDCGIYKPEEHGPKAIPSPSQMQRLQLLADGTLQENSVAPSAEAVASGEEDRPYTELELVAMMESITAGRRSNLLDEESFKKLSKEEQRRLQTTNHQPLPKMAGGDVKGL
eukprot:GDKJ01037125.1.p1 GENE.GDKJ01037125.1~~GDKJ01037125.1.p1  ORF type:complete len:345 (-),score=72.41 GDKJ01037125.1:93-1127(-)